MNLNAAETATLMEKITEDASPLVEEVSVTALRHRNGLGFNRLFVFNIYTVFLKFLLFVLTLDGQVAELHGL